MIVVRKATLWVAFLRWVPKKAERKYGFGVEGHLDPDLAPPATLTRYRLRRYGTNP
jgi:hypothetical protein